MALEADTVLAQLRARCLSGAPPCVSGADFSLLRSGLPRAFHLPTSSSVRSPPLPSSTLHRLVTTHHPPPTDLLKTTFFSPSVSGATFARSPSSPPHRARPSHPPNSTTAPFDLHHTNIDHQTIISILREATTTPPSSLTSARARAHQHRANGRHPRSAQQNNPSLTSPHHSLRPRNTPTSQTELQALLLPLV